MPNWSPSTLSNPLTASDPGFKLLEQTVNAASYPGVLDLATYGALGDGRDSTQALLQMWRDVNASSAPLVDVWIGPGTYSFTQNLVWSVTGTTPKAVRIRGVPGATIFKPTAAVTATVTLATDANSDGTTNRLHVAGIQLEGANTTGATGWLVGENAANLSGNIVMEDCHAYRFSGVGGIGIYVKNATGCRYVRCYFGRSATNGYIGGSDLALPTLQTFSSCEFREAGYTNPLTEAGIGVNLQNGYRVTFDEGCLFEANRAEGFSSVPTNPLAVVLYCAIDNAWFESNFFGSASIATNYHLRLDGTGAGTVMMALRNVNTNGLTRSMYVQRVVNFVMDNVLPRNVANQIVIDPVTPNQTVGEYNNWPRNSAIFATCVTNNSTAFRGREDLFVVNALIASGKVTAGSFESQGIARFDNILQGKAGGSGDSLLLRIGTAGGLGSLQASTATNIAHWDDSLMTFDAMPSANGYKVSGTQVVSSRQAAITTPNAQTAAYVQADATSLKTAIDAIRSALIAHGLTS